MKNIIMIWALFIMLVIIEMNSIKYTTEILKVSILILIIIVSYQIYFKQKEFECRLHNTEGVLSEYLLKVQTDTKGNITYVSKAFLKLSGFSEQELIGQTHKLLKHPERKHEIIVDLWKTIRNREVWTGKIMNKTKAGERLILQALVSPLFKGNKLIGYSTIYQDITAEIKLYDLNKYLEEDIKEKEKLLMNRLRLAQMGEMMAMIGHQWRQPLAAITSIINTIKIKIAKDTCDTFFIKEKTEQIETLSQSLANTINDFKDFYKIEKNLKEVNLREIIEYTLKLIQPSLDEKHIKIEKDLVEIKVLIYGNELQQVILNLIKNSEDILMERNIENKEIKIRVKEKESIVALEIEDNGGGIEPGIMEKIFDPYFTTKETLNGSGLGLYMSKIIVEEHLSGTLSAKNKNNGAIFTIILKKN